MARKFYTDIDLLSLARVINVPAPALGTDAVNKDYVDSLISGLAWKDSVKVVSLTNISISSPGSVVDGITLSTGDRILLIGQTLAAENGIYVFDTDTTALTRAADASTAASLLQAIVPVEEGTNADSSYRQTENIGVLGTDSVIFVDFAVTTPQATETVAGKIELATQAEVDAGVDTERAITPATLANYANLDKSYTALIGDGLSTTITVTHNLGTENVVMSVREAAGDKVEVYPEVRYVDSNTINLLFSIAPLSNSFKVVVVR